jgi:hypothetical protein
VTESELIDWLVTVCNAYGWDIALPEENGDGILPGLSIGTTEYLDGLIKDKSKFTRVVMPRTGEPLTD